jgi:hypothetical protein
MDISNTPASPQMPQRIYNPKILSYVEIFTTLLGDIQYNEQCPSLIVPAAEYNVNCICRTCNTVKCLQLIFGEAEVTYQKLISVYKTEQRYCFYENSIASSKKNC